MTDRTIERPSTPSLISEAIQKATALFTTEISLVRLEATEKIGLILASIASLVFAAVFIMVALIFLLQGLIYFMIAKGFPGYEASFIVGGTLAGVALIAALVALRNMSAAKLAPKRTIGQIHAATSVVKRGVR